MLRLLTAGESHGRKLVAILEGIPAGVSITRELIDGQLRLRQAGYGRGARMQIEADSAMIISGVRFGKSLGSPVAIEIENKDWENWKEKMATEANPPARLEKFTRPRPGHADLAGAMKFGTDDIRNVLERASARETAARVAAGAIAKAFLSELEMDVLWHVVSIGGAGARSRTLRVGASHWKRVMESEMFCGDGRIEKVFKARIDRAKARGESVGGVFEVIASGVPAGLGSPAQWDKRLNARLAMAVMSIQAIKGVEIGLGFDSANRTGSEVHDEIFHGGGRYYRKTNNAGGIEGGMSNGEDIVVRAAMKPIPTLRKPLRSVDISNRKPYRAGFERSDVCAVPAASVVASAMVALVLADAVLEKFGGDSISETRRNLEGYKKGLAKL
jgi:chorismate synthase